MLERTVGYVDGDDGQIAYASFGSGPLDLLYVDDWAWHIDTMFDDPVRAGNAFGCAVMPIGGRRRDVTWGSGRVEADVLDLGLAVGGWFRLRGGTR